MTYEYRSGSQTLELPNPYTIENRLLFSVGGVFVVAGVILLFIVRHDFLARAEGSAILPLVSGVFLLTCGVAIVAIGLKQLRFFFGRERPGGISVNMAPLQEKGRPVESMITEVAHNREGESDAARALEETIRRGALPFAEPVGPVNGILYRWYRGLIYAVRPLQNLAQKQFMLLAFVAAILVSFAVSWVLATGPGVMQWVAISYLAIAVLYILRPLFRFGRAARAGRRRAKAGLEKLDPATKAVIGLIVLAIILPVIFMNASPMNGLHPVPVTLLLLLLVGVAALLFFVALRAQLGAPPPASSSVHQVALSMNCHPAQLSEELARTLQKNWIEQIPNRHYVNKQPKINTAEQGSGSFVSEVLEETQPFPVKTRPPQSFAECRADSTRGPVLWLQLYGAALLVLSAIGLAWCAWWYTPLHLERYGADFYNDIAYIIVGFIVGGYCVNGAHALFGRFDFESLVYWVESRGSYQVASANYGNVLSDRIHTKKSLINIETATLRVWVVELYTVVFGKDGKRFIRAMLGRADDAKALAEELVAFAGNQSVVVAPTAPQDMEKMAGMAQLGTAVQGAVSRETLAAAVLHNPDLPGDGEPEAAS